MGVLNVTPDSFYDGGKFFGADSAIEQALKLETESADIIDIGAESTRPGAKFISEEEELERLLPVIKALKTELSIPISIDTNKPRVMQETIKAGASIINDITALSHPDAMSTIAKLNVPVCLMHMQGQPDTMQINPVYDDINVEITHYFEKKINSALAHGIAREHIILDPGFGFGKTLEHNLLLVNHIQTLKKHFNLPLLIGVSRKSSIGKMLNESEVENRLFGSLALQLICALNGADIIRTHDVKATKDTLTILNYVSEVNNKRLSNEI